MDIWAGTSGYSYKAWKGSFYPEKLPAAKMLDFYAERLPAVEINNTFYRMPKASVLEGWAARVPERFRFVLKASRRITHFKRLKDTAEETGYLLQTARALGDRLGALLFQLPPNLKLDLPRLDAFLELLPEDVPAVLEFRHASWQEESVAERLRARNLALCMADTDEEPAPEALGEGAWGYLRLRRESYSETELAEWARWVRTRAWNPTYVFFKHEEQGPMLAARFLELCLETRTPRRALPARSAARGTREAG